MKPALPVRIDRMPVESRKPRAGPLLDIEEAIACGINSIPFEWWKHMPVSPSSEPVKAIRDSIRMAGYTIGVAGRDVSKE